MWSIIVLSSILLPGIGRIRELHGLGVEGLDLQGLRRELGIWGYGLRSTILFDSAIPFQLAGHLERCKSVEVRRVLEDLFAELQQFHATTTSKIKCSFENATKMKVK